MSKLGIKLPKIFLHATKKVYFIINSLTYFVYHLSDDINKIIEELRNTPYNHCNWFSCIWLS